MEKDFLAPKAKKNDSMIFFTLPSIIGMSNLAADLAKHDLVYGAIWEGVIDGIGHMLKVFYPWIYKSDSCVEDQYNIMYS
jgi:hypothetical protein